MKKTRWFVVVLVLLGCFSVQTKSNGQELTDSLKNDVKKHPLILIGEVKKIGAGKAAIEVQRVLKGAVREKFIEVHNDSDEVCDGRVYHKGERGVFFFEPLRSGEYMPPSLYYIDKGDKVDFFDSDKPDIVKDNDIKEIKRKGYSLYKHTMTLKECIQRIEKYLREEK